MLLKLTYEDACLGQVYDFHERELRPERYPLQIGSAAIAATPKGAFYVLALFSNTITELPAHGEPTPVIDLAKLERYRGRAIGAFLTMFGRIAQFLKDCVCEHLLVDCPNPAGKKVYLADVSFKDGKIYQICNFHHRKYVHTFPTIEHWMSLVPIIPMLERAVEKACCAVIAGVFDRLVPAEKHADRRADRLSTAMFRNALTHLSALDLRGQYNRRKAQLGLGGKAAKAALSRPSPGNAVAPLDPEDVALKTTAEIGPTPAGPVGVSPPDLILGRAEIERDPLRAAFQVATAPTVTRGDTVDVVTDPGGRVLGWRRAAPAAIERRPRTEPVIDGPIRVAPVASGEAEVAKLRLELARMAELTSRTRPRSPR